MPELTAALETIRPELMNVTRLFGLPESVWDEPVRYRMSTTETPEKYIVTFKDGTDSATGEAEIPSDPDPRVQALHRRRAARREHDVVQVYPCNAVIGRIASFWAIIHVYPR